MKYKNQIIILMVILILFNTLSNPIKSNAAAIPITVSMGSAAKAFLAFILASTAVGITYSTLEDAKSTFTSVSDMTNEQLADWIFGTPPPPQNQGPPNKFKWYDILGLGFIGGAVTQQLNDFIDTIKEKFGELQEGENSFENEYFFDNNNAIRIVKIDNKRYFELNGVVKMSYILSTDMYDQKIISVELLSETADHWRYKIYTSTKRTSTSEWLEPYAYTNYYSKVDHNGVIEQTPSKTISISADAPVLDPVQNPPPEKIYLPYLPTLDPDNDKIEEVYLPTGDKRVIYDGTEDEYYTDIVNNIDLEQLQDPDLKVGEVTIIDGQIVIDTPIDNPFPNPELDPNPELPENEQDMIPWIQVVINWISQTKNSIDNIITPPEEYIPPELDFTPFSNIVILDKFPFSLPWDLKRVVETLTTKDTEAPLFEVDFPIEVSSVNWKQDVKFDIDFDRFTPLANIMRTMLSLIFVVGLVIVTRRFIGGA